MERERVFGLFDLERQYQNNKWGDLDTRNSVADFLTYMYRYYTHALTANNPDTPVESLTAVVKLGALCTACLETHM